jgi:hypothetical protein
MIRSSASRRIAATAASAAALLATACASVDVTPVGQAQVRSEDVQRRNYRLGEPREVVVGQPIVQVQSYRLTRQEAASVVASADFVIEGSGFRIAGRKDEQFPVRGTTEVEGQLHYVVPIAGYEFFVSPEGVVHRDVKTEAYAWKIATQAEVTPPEARLVPRESRKVSGEGAYANFELLYGGSDGRAIQVTYREFTPDDPTKPSFFQSLSYDTSSDVIRYRDFVVKVLEATNQTLSYVVVSDGSGGS